MSAKEIVDICNMMSFFPCLHLFFNMQINFHIPALMENSGIIIMDAAVRLMKKILILAMLKKKYKI